MDTIDREAALKAVHEAIAEGKSWYSALSHLPSAEKTGRWVMFDNKYFCSNCGKQHDYRTYYCPNCGASMENEDE